MEDLKEKIVKKGNKWQVQSESGRNMGTYNTKEEAQKRLKQIEYFKHINEDKIVDKTIFSYDIWDYWPLPTTDK